MADDWVQEPDDVPWSESMRWQPSNDVVPLCPEEFLPWRVAQMRHDLWALDRQLTDARRDADVRVRALGLDPRRQDDDRVDAARLLVDALRAVDPQMPGDYLAACPPELLESVVRGGTATVRLQGGQEVELRHRRGSLEAHIVPEPWEGWPWADRPQEDPVLERSEFSIDFAVDQEQADWFERLMDSMTHPVRMDPVPPAEPVDRMETFLTRLPERQARDGDVPGIQAWGALPGDPAVTDADAAPRLHCPEARYESMIPPEDHARMLEQVRERYQEMTGIPWPFALPDGTYIGPGQDTQGGHAVMPDTGAGSLMADILSSHNRTTDTGMEAWITPLGADGQPDGEPVRFPGPVTVRFEADTGQDFLDVLRTAQAPDVLRPRTVDPGDDVRGGHM